MKNKQRGNIKRHKRKSGKRETNKVCALNLLLPVGAKEQRLNKRQDKPNIQF